MRAMHLTIPLQADVPTVTHTAFQSTTCTGEVMSRAKKIVQQNMAFHELAFACSSLDLSCYHM
jgi:hypothetical protein